MSEQDFNLNEEKIAEKPIINEDLAQEEQEFEQIEDNFESETEKTEQKTQEPISFFRIPEPTPEEKEKQAIKRSGRAVGISFLVLYGLMWAINLIALLIVKIFTPTYTGAVSLLSDPAVLQVEQIIFSLSVFTLPFIIVFIKYIRTY